MTTVLLVSANPDFAATVIARWQSERMVPAFVTLGAAAVSEPVIPASDIAITGPAPSDSLVAILRTLDAAGRPAICVAPDSETAFLLRHAHHRAVVLRDHEGWLDNLVILGNEVLHRVETATRARRAEAALAEAQQNATLGRFMLDMRHGLNNALTSILGNSELLLLEPGALSADHRDQVTTMHSMALRIHEVVQRFTSLELEMKLYSQSHHEIPLAARTLVPATASRPEMAPESAISTTHGSRVS